MKPISVSAWPRRWSARFRWVVTSTRYFTPPPMNASTMAAATRRRVQRFGWSRIHRRRSAASTAVGRRDGASAVSRVTSETTWRPSDAGGGSMSPRRLRSSNAAPTTSGRYAGAPDSISCRTIPNAYMSLAAVAGSPRACSGLMCDRVPVMPPDCETKGAAVHAMGETVSPSEARRVVSGSVSPGSSGRSSAARGAGSAAAATCARPKSSTLTSPPAVTRTLPGFRSRCTIPAACVATRTSVICCASRSRPAVSRPSTARPRPRPSISSSTSQSWSSPST
jgi:hypothetical protein